MGEDEGGGAAHAGCVSELGDQPFEFLGQESAAVELRGGACGEELDPALHGGPDVWDGAAGREVCHCYEGSTFVGEGSHLRGSGTCSADACYG